MHSTGRQRLPDGKQVPDNPAPARALQLQVVWLERGGTVTEPERKGFGSRLIVRGLAGEFGKVSLEFRPQGVACALEFSQPTASNNPALAGPVPCQGIGMPGICAGSR